MSPKGTFAVVFGFGSGVWCALSAVRKILAWQRIKHWPSIRGTVTESLLYQDPQRKNATHFRVKYEFIVGDKIVGSTPRFSGNWFWTNKHQARFVARFSPGQIVDVYYDPRDPTKNCLDREDVSGITILWIIAVGATVLASLIVWLDRTD